ncbi:hypothetical protein SCP_1900370 [Sparassis crispa]|uniref:Uncharacterized protein n=1 Tax=Sparassis crispa TaxID=139825 RepID=A0A401H6W1_9APHY|nr:hypothetical protein SCP_1900370 [Sparassis crispa]GBE90188.1 hypothetical protein SCP_1900370 [Sparassis crispa]
MTRDLDPWQALRQLEVPSPEVLDAAAEALNEALIAATEKVVPKSEPCKQSKKWWSKELTALKDLLSSQRQEAREWLSRYQDENTHWTKRIKATANRLAREIKKAKREWVEMTLQEATSKNVWDVNKWTKGTRQYPSPAIQ